MKKIIIVGFAIVFCFEVFSQAPTIQWQRCLGGHDDETAYSIIQTADGGYLAVGNTQSNTGEVSGNHGWPTDDEWVVKMDNLGNIQWQKCLGGTTTDYALSVISVVNGYVTCGGAGSNDGDLAGAGNHGQLDLWIVGLNTSGNIIWKKCLGGSLTDEGRSIVATADGGYAMAGYTSSSNGDVSGNHGSTDFWVVKTNNTGVVQWQKCLGGTLADHGNSIIQTTDGGYAVTGYTRSNNGDVSGNHGGADYWVVKLDANGTIQWKKCLGGTADDVANSIVQASDGGYVVAGYTKSTDGDVTGNSGFSNFWLVKLDNAGTLQWQKCFGWLVDDQASSIIKTADGGYAVTGFSCPGAQGFCDYSVVKFDVNGTMEWYKYLGGPDDDRAFSLIQTTDGGYAVAGFVKSGGGDVTGYDDADDFWIVKLMFDIGMGEQSEDQWNILVSPNPAISELTIENREWKMERVEIYNVLGEKVFPSPLVPLSSRRGDERGEVINVSSFSPGIYFVKVTGEKEERVAKFVKQ